jgi:hypothetical protein
MKISTEGGPSTQAKRSFLLKVVKKLQIAP